MELDVYVALHYSKVIPSQCIGNIVSSTAALLQTVYHLPLLPLLRDVLAVCLLAALAVLFRPLLTGIGRALVLVVKPHRSKEELAARRHMRDARMLQKMIHCSLDASQEAELRAMGARA
jgi:hypothetical protein